MPWLAANGIELRWVPADEFAAFGPRAAVDLRLKHPYRSDVVLLLDADTLIRRPLDDLIAASPSRPSPGRDYRARLALAVRAV